MLGDQVEPINTCCGRHGGDSAGCGAGGGRGSGGHTPPPRGQAGHGDTLHTAQDTVHAIAARSQFSNSVETKSIYLILYMK